MVCCLFLCYCQIGTVKAVDPTVFIQADGSIEGTDNITKNGDVYIFKGDVTGSLFVAKSNIIIDGAGYTLQGSNTENSKGIYSDYKDNVRIRNLVVKDFDYGICLMYATNFNITANTVTSERSGGEPWAEYGIILHSSSNCTISGNDIKNSACGIAVQNSNDNSISENWATGNGRGIELIGSQGNLVSGNYAAENDDGIVVENQNNRVVENTITNNNDAGIYMFSATLNEITGNDVTNNERGMHITFCTQNSIFGNNFADNTLQIDTDASDSIWDVDQQGNYWGDYTGSDSNSDGIGDTAYTISENNQDNYPLMASVDVEEIPEFGSFAVLMGAVTLVAAILAVYKRKLSHANV
ncbi:MAG: right-handed parallel beta-helix repeat-containing protein [Candidatus Bathyarchaeota archaeon]|nr:right-handed parallel beta-helix repeat-containing protein [Candidatus Bathyarchaeota archaeon]